MNNKIIDLLADRRIINENIIRLVNEDIKSIPVHRHRSEDIQERQHSSRQERLGIRQAQNLLPHPVQLLGYGKGIR